jgi:UDP-N-acetylglucosamine 2-epimerase
MKMMNKIKVMSCFGTRPEAIKMAPLIKELDNDERIDSVVCVTAQHREMLDQVLKAFGIVPDFDLNIMESRQTLTHITSKALTGLDTIIKEIRPDFLLVQGDTTTAMAASLAGFYNKIPIGHVEAGLRTYNRYSPFPEEMNRKIITAIAQLHFAPTRNNKDNLIKENVDAKDICITGNTAIDVLKTTVRKDHIFCCAELNRIDFKNKRIITLTAHRRENLGEPLYNIDKAVKRIANDFNDIEVVYPIHLNPEVRKTAGTFFSGDPRIHLVEPIDVFDMHNLMARSYLVMTDSGGLQEEAPSLGKPVLVLRTETERPEAVAAGTVKLSGIVEQDIYNDAKGLLDNKAAYDRMANRVNPYGDGNASGRIKDAILYFHGIIGTKPLDWEAGDG